LCPVGANFVLVDNIMQSSQRPNKILVTQFLADQGNTHS
jgi:hypothetical protein